MNQDNILIVLLVSAIVFLAINKYKTDEIVDRSEYNTRVAKQISELKTELDNKIELLKQFTKENQEKTNISNRNNELNKTIITTTEPVIVPDFINQRDVNVIDNPLYPILNRAERPISDMILANNQFLNFSTRGSPDTYRPMAIAKKVGEVPTELYYLMGRQKYQGSSQGEFYLTSMNKDKNIKIPINRDNTNPRLNDYYNLPTTLEITSGIFANDIFQIQELPTSDLSSGYY